MRRVSYAAFACAGLLAAAVGTATTASNTVPSSTVGYNAVTVNGGTMKGISYMVAGNTITGFTVQLKGPQIKLGVTLFSTVVARFGDGLNQPCVIGLYDAAADQTPAVCTGFTQPANQSWRLTITLG